MYVYEKMERPVWMCMSTETATFLCGYGWIERQISLCGCVWIERTQHVCVDVDVCVLRNGEVCVDVYIYR